MLYISLKEIAEKFPNKLAVNDMTYSELISNALARPYVSICHETGVNVLLDVLKAASINKPIIVLPKDDRESAIIPVDLPDKFLVVLYSSGSTGVRKPIILPETMIMASVKNVIRLHNIVPEDKILTVCSLNHTAGLTCHTLGGLLSGASIVVEQFSPFSLLRLLEEHGITLAHILPIMSEAVMKSHVKPNLSKLRIVWTGSDCITRQQIEYWLNPTCDLFFGYGMTEVGPPTTYHMLKYGDDLSMFDRGYPVGTQILCESKIIDNELWVKGDIVNIEGWFQTGDCFKYEDGWFFYTGRKKAGGKIVPKGSVHF